jgi:hypothetical protein
MVGMRGKDGNMKKRSGLFIVLLLSVLMFGVFGLTAFAEDQAAHTHQWDTATPADNGVAFRCADESCEYYYDTYKGYNRIFMDAGDAYSGVPYDSQNISYKYESTDMPDEVVLSEPEYYTEEGALLDAAPDKAGKYVASVSLLVNGEAKRTMTDSFELKSFTLEPESVQYGAVSNHKILLDGEQVDLEKLPDEMYCEFEYLSLDSTKSEYTFATPVDAGHYRIKATLYQPKDEEYEVIATMGEATGEYEIKKADDVWAFQVYVKDPKALLKVDPEVLKCDDAAELFMLLYDLSSRDMISFEGEFGDPVIVYVGANGALYSSKTMGNMVITYKKEGDKISKPFVQGVSVMGVGENKLTLTIKGSRNNEKIVKEIYVPLEKASAKLVKAPKAKEGLVFNDRYQELVEPGTALGGTLYYAIDNGTGKLNWSKTVPTAKDATDTGDADTPYAVKYKIVANNKNYKDVEFEEPLLVSIASKSADADEETDSDDFDFLAPAKVKLVTVVKKTKKSAVVKFRRVSEADYYQYSVTNKAGKVIATGTVDQDITTFLKTKVKGLDKNTNYKVKVRAVAIYDDEAHYGDWSKAVSFKTKK